MSYFKKNPAALLDAIPTPREQEKEDILSDFKSGLTPKKNMNFKFNDSISMQRKSSKNLLLL
jgi:hypothetical protein